MERATPKDVNLILKKDIPYELRERVNTYFEQFAKPVPVGKVKHILFGYTPCLSCGAFQGGATGRFREDKYGGGECGKCGYPGVALHFIWETDEEAERATNEMVKPWMVYGPWPLQFHPDMVEVLGDEDTGDGPVDIS